MSLPKPIVDHKVAEQLLRQAIMLAQDESSQLLATEWDAQIRTIIKGKHLTFRYILITALLGKATNPNINALALQAGADIEGAYDARSLCHKVLVPLERQMLNRSLGGSNEPFLNKPARFPTISPSNAVRAGKDRELLLILHKVLSEIETSEQAFAGLCIAVRYAIERQTTRSELFSEVLASADSHLKILEFVEAFVTKSIEGQVAAILTGTILSLYFEQFESFEVIVHPVNQSGASSNEVADIDIKKNGKLFVAVEVKDKQFSEQDIDHAAFKASQYGLKSITFIMGTRATYIGSSLEQVSRTVMVTQNINVIFIDIVSFIKSIIALCPELSFSRFFEKLQDCATSVRVKDEVFEHINHVFQTIQAPLK
ncbi:restriction endonuclease, SacI family [Microcoleus sp. FACHB-672]|uniref:restriction endonuclease, SacI family n=1 Tax=Microcoleus sp. FACHB-672 TaxID=2692825 RepID=UPI00168666E4|nr:restriction endonuclease, SacI family [Microcoleus sp. FACHB-672]MBD2042862.1 restriction endonuclease, SacI family [Microcoleus sp. FACHB-672]